MEPIDTAPSISEGRESAVPAFASARKPKRGLLWTLIRIFPLKLSPEKLSEDVTPGIKAELIRQEHRLIPIVLNGFRYWHLSANDPRRAAALEAGIFRIFTSPAAQTTTIGVFGMVTAAATIFLAFRANEIGQNQTLIAIKQVEIAEQQASQSIIQNALSEAQRMAMLSEQIQEIGRDFELLRERGINKSEVLEARIIALSNSLKPYRHLIWTDEKPELSKEMLSRERGQLFHVCMVAIRNGYGLLVNVESPPANMAIWDPIPFIICRPSVWIEESLDFLRKADFSYSDLSESEDLHWNLSGLRLSHCRFRNLKSDGVKFNGADLSYADFSGSYLFTYNFVSARISGTSFAGALPLPPAERFRGAYWDVHPNFDNAIVLDDPKWLLKFCDRSRAADSEKKIVSDKYNIVNGAPRAPNAWKFVPK